MVNHKYVEKHKPKREETQKEEREEMRVEEREIGGLA